MSHLRSAAFVAHAAAIAWSLMAASAFSAEEKKIMETPDPEAPKIEPANTSEPTSGASSVEQGSTTLTDAFEWNARDWRLEKRRAALRDTTFKLNFRTMFLDREKYDGSESEALAIGGWAGFKTGYFLDHIAFGATGYTSQRLVGDKDKDGTLLLAPGQHGYTVLGELFADIRIVDGLNLNVGRKEFDTPYINRNDVRMTPNTFEAAVLQGKAKFGEDGGTLKYGAGYFNRIKERNSDEFVSMSTDAGASVHRGVYTAGAIYEREPYSVGAIDYYSPDIINIFYTEAKVEIPICWDLKLRLAGQFSDQRSTGDDLLQGDDFAAHQFGFKAEVPVGPALFTAAYTQAGGDANMQNPWSGYPGYTSVQVEDFNRDGEGAFLLRAGYDFPFLKGLSAYALWVHGTEPDAEGQYRRDEYDVNLQYAVPKGVLKGLSLRLRYAYVKQHGGNSDDLQDFRAICNYAYNF